MPGNLTFPYTDDPSGLTGWKTSGLPRLGEDYVDDSDGFHRACRRRGDAVHYCEAFPYQTDDGVVHMMLRTNGTALSVTESSDRGETWSEPRMTSYSDCRSKHQFGRFPDGRFFGLNCPEPASKRTPLVLAASDDGVTFDRHYVLGAEPLGFSREAFVETCALTTLPRLTGRIPPQALDRSFQYWRPEALDSIEGFI